ncbi:hypothetical protein BAUCODRAFT_69355 [Baudoinia panamericana UAMH 10762]|uniref:Sugar phosphate transporter domain-containing protein n=1 Tax=Baudoinia panamericana (strain UAMH 10762) TaxID=717646 RepID=M2MX80_BAUPA|nr:uncharacterized protein BAUCODRAFT_69355 [Baudoinia panamericana UAMH 10762]EMC96158.1 hypothetical protein BAUCODRAFT_69355 [Baudoinia panamericana UAMH 10762]
MVPHATEGSGVERRRSSSANPNGKFKFPDLQPEYVDGVPEETAEDISRDRTPQPLPNGLPPGLHSSERWPSRKRDWSAWAKGASADGARHSKQKSLTEAIRTVRTRKASISENAQEIAESLKAPVSGRLVVLCMLWYGSSILTNTSSKTILTALPKPVTLTIIQFLLVGFWCVFLSWLAKHNKSVRDSMPVLKNGIRRPNRDIIMATLPLTAFQIGGHILNSDAMARIPVSLVHTIKGLSPMMTVLAYRAFFGIEFSVPTYLSLIPLTLGVIMACSASFKDDIIGLVYAFGSAILFVTQNIVSKKIFNEAAKAESDGTPMARRKPDKLNLLCYSSILAFLITCPIWLWSEGWSLFADYMHDGTIDLRQRPGALDHGRLALEFLLNGTFHFGQSLVAFVLLGMVTPVTYSVASLMKRVAVIMFAIIWFGNPMSTLQGFGFAMTFLGLYLYDRTSDAAKKEKVAREQLESSQMLLPLNVADLKRNEPVFAASPLSGAEDVGQRSFSGANGYANGEPVGSGIGRSEMGRHGTPPAVNGITNSLPPGTRAEDTWKAGDMGMQEVAAVR